MEQFEKFFFFTWQSHQTTPTTSQIWRIFRRRQRDSENCRKSWDFVASWDFLAGRGWEEQEEKEEEEKEEEEKEEEEEEEKWLLKKFFQQATAPYNGAFYVRISLALLTKELIKYITFYWCFF